MQAAEPAAVRSVAEPWGSVDAADLGASLDSGSRRMSDRAFRAVGPVLQSKLTRVNAGVPADANEISDKILRELIDHFRKYRLRDEDFEYPGIWCGQIEVMSFASYLVKLDVDPVLLRSEFLWRWLNWEDTQAWKTRHMLEYAA